MWDEKGDACFQEKQGHVLFGVHQWLGCGA